MLRAGQVTEAEAVFRENMKRYPRNGRTLSGLIERLKLQKKERDAAWVKKEFENVWDSSAPTLRIKDLERTTHTKSP